MGSYTQNVRSEVEPSTDPVKTHIQTREDDRGNHYCVVKTILEQLGIERATGLVYHHVDDKEDGKEDDDRKEAQFIDYLEKTKLPYYAGRTIVVSLSTNEHSSGSPLQSRKPRPIRQLTSRLSFLKNDPHPQESRDPPQIDNQDGTHNAQKGGKQRGPSIRRKLTDRLRKIQTIKLVSSGKEYHIPVHFTPPSNYHCHVSEIAKQLGWDATESKMYKYKVGDTEFEFKKDKQNRIDFDKKIKYCDQVIEIFEAPSSPAVSDMTLASLSPAERNPNSRRESNGADSQSTAHTGYDHCFQADPQPEGIPEKDFRSLLSTHSQGYCGKTLQDVNLFLTKATHARKVFDALAKLTCVRTLNVTLAWNFKKSDLRAMVKSLSRSSVVHLTLDLKDKNSWKRPKVRFLFGRKYQPLQDLYLNRNLQTFHLVGASRFGIRTNPPTDKPASNLKNLHLRIRLDGKSDQAAAQSIIKKCPKLTDLRLGGIYNSQMHMDLKSTIKELRYLKVLHLYGMERNELGGPILDLLGDITSAGNKLEELVLVNSKMDAVETQALIRKCERTLRTIVLDHATFQPPNLRFLGPIPSEQPLLQNLTSLHLHVCENIESLQLLVRILKQEQLKLAHLGLTQSDPKVIQDLLGGSSLLQHVSFASLQSLFLSGFNGTSLDPLWGALKTTTGSDSSKNLGEITTVDRTGLQYLSLEYISKCPDLAFQLRRRQLESLWIVADARECELDQLAITLDYSSLKKVAFFRTGSQRGPSVGSYFGKLEGYLQTSSARDMTIRVGDFKQGKHDELSGLKVLSYIVDNSGGVTRGPNESVCKDHNPRYHRYRWGMTGWSGEDGPGAGCI
ncbi:hypothetical protein BGZ72_003698 [Mortierella alpina]|nr:hypothetical protein BGZ72_003698 [Mortierella alpina]